MPFGEKYEYILTETVYRKMSVPIAKFLARFNLTPNQITIFATIVGIILLLNKQE